MTHVSRRKIPDKTKAVLLDALIYGFSNLKPTQAHKILSALLTNTETIMLAKRLGIAYLLRENAEEVDIAEIVKTTRQTVARIRLQLDAGSPESREFLIQKLAKWERVSLFKSLLKTVGLGLAKEFAKNLRRI